jgi:hypothetical protein
VKRLAAAPLTTTLTASPANAADRVDRITAALRQSPVFVDPDVSYLLNAQDRTKLTRQIATAGVPIYLIAVPLLSQDESAETATTSATSCTGASAGTAST